MIPLIIFCSRPIWEHDLDARSSFDHWIIHHVANALRDRRAFISIYEGAAYVRDIWNCPLQRRVLTGRRTSVWQNIRAETERRGERKKNRIDLITRSGDVSYVGSRAGGERQKCASLFLLFLSGGLICRTNGNIRDTRIAHLITFTHLAPPLARRHLWRAPTCVPVSFARRANSPRTGKTR